MDSSVLICPFCNKNFNLRSISIHCSLTHKISSKELCLKLFYKNIEPICLCGCGLKTRFKNLKEGFSKWFRNHMSIYANPYAEKSVQKKSQETRRMLWKNGHIKAWCKGKSKETDLDVFNMSKNVSKTIKSNKELLKKRSIDMKINRINGIIPTLYGKDSSQWKGGKSRINALCHSNKVLYRKWKYPILKKANFKCEKCLYNKNLHIHHNFIKMSEIISIIAKKYELNNLKNLLPKIKNKFIKDVVDYHIDNNILGIVLCVKCHRFLHNSMNFL